MAVRIGLFSRSVDAELPTLLPELPTELVSLAVQMNHGEESALQWFFDRFHQSVFSTALRHLADEGAAERATVSFFADVWREKTFTYRSFAVKLSAFDDVMRRAAAC
jgi:hypothetical protein